MTLKERMLKIKELQAAVTTPWHVSRVFGKADLFGEQVTFGMDKDYVTLDEARESLEWIVEQLGGKVKWEENKKGSKNGRK